MIQGSGNLTSGPLNGVRVLELGTMIAGPWAGRVLADFGAEVVKLEDPEAGDPGRVWPPVKDGESLAFFRLNMGKKSVVIDLSQDLGRDVALQLLERTDVMVTNRRPKTLNAWGLDYASLGRRYPRLVYVGITAYGKDGPDGGGPGFGAPADGISGFSNIVGFPSMPPSLAHFGFADCIAGTAAAFGAAMSLFRRELSGHGDEVDVALYEPLMAILGDIVVDYSVLGAIRMRRGNSPGQVSPTGTFLTKDGKWVVISGSSQNMAQALFRAMGREELIRDARFASNLARVENENDLRSLVQTWVATMTRDEVLDLLDQHKVVCGPVNTAEDIMRDPHFRYRTLVSGDDPVLGSVTVPGRQAQLAGSPQVPFAASPDLGEHTDQVLYEWAGIDQEALADLRRQGVLGRNG